MSEELDGAVAESEQEAPIVDTRDPGAENRQRRAIFDLPIEIVVSVGRASLKISDLLDLRKDSLVELDAKIDDPIEILVGKRVVARGQLEEIEDTPSQLGVRLTEIVNIGEAF